MKQVRKSSPEAMSTQGCAALGHIFPAPCALGAALRKSCVVALEGPFLPSICPVAAFFPSFSSSMHMSLQLSVTQDCVIIF